MLKAIKYVLLVILFLTYSTTLLAQELGEPRYELTIDGNVGHAGSSRCGNGYGNRGLNSLSLVYANGEKRVFFQENIDDNRPFVAETSYSELNEVVSLEIYSGFRIRSSRGCRNQQAWDYIEINNGCSLISFDTHDFGTENHAKITGEIDIRPIINLARPIDETDIAGYEDPLTVLATEGFPSEIYKWQYRIEGGDWMNIYRHSPIQNPHILEFLPEKYLEKSDIGKWVNFRILPCEGKPSENVVSYRIMRSAPDVLGTAVSYVSCYDGSDGSVKLFFSRLLEEGDNLNISIVDLSDEIGNDNGTIIYQQVADTTNLTKGALDEEYSITLKGLPPSNPDFGYRIDLMGGYNGENYYTGDDSHTNKFKIERPESPVDFKIKGVVNVYCNNGADGEIHLLASGGWDGDYEYKILESNQKKFSDRDWEAEGEWIIFDNDTHEIKNLEPNIEYGIKVRKKLEKGGHCYARKQVPVNGSIGLEEEKIEIVKLTQPETKLQVEYLENSSREPSANGYSDGFIRARIYGGTMFENETYNFEWRDSDNNILTDDEENFDTEYQFGQGYFITLKNLPADTYYLTVWDKNFDDATEGQGCTIINSEWTLNQPDPLIVEIEESSSISCYGETGGELIAHAKGGVELRVTDNGGLLYYYTWKKKNEKGNWTTLSETSDKLSDIGSGEYAVNIEDAKGIVIGRSENNVVVEPEDVTYTLIEPGLLEIGSSKTDVYCYGGNDGAIDITITGGTEPYNIEWQSDQWETNKTSEDLTGLTAGTYYVKVTDKEGCTANKTIEIKEPEELVVTYPSQFFQPTGFGLSDGWIEATVSGGTSDADGTYIFEWRDENGQLVNSQVVTSVDAATGVSILRLQAIGTGTYSLVVRDGNYAAATSRGGCNVANLSYSLESPGQMQVLIAEHTPISCNSGNEYNNPASDGKLVAHASGGVKFSPGLPYKYTWKKKNETTGVWDVLTTQTDSIAINLNAGEYAVNIEDKNGIILGKYENNVLTQAIDSIYELREPDLLEVTFNTQNVYCYSGNDGWAEAVISGGTPPYEYLWDNGETTARRSSMEAGEYEVIVTDSRGCEVIGSVEVEEPTNEFTADYTSYGIPSSMGASDAWIEVLISGGTPFDDGRYVYEWTNAFGDVLNTKTETEVVNESGSTLYRVRLYDVPSGAYYLTVTDKNYEIAETKFGCSIIESEFKISEPIEATIEVYSPVSCHSQNTFSDPSSDGSLVAHVEGGVPFSVGQPYNYIWKQLDENGRWVVIEGQDTEIATGLGAGTYALNVEDSQGNVIGTYESGLLIEAHDVLFEFEEPDLLQVELSSTTISCDAGNDGTISVSISGGVPGYEIQWSTGETTPQISNVIAGTYMVYVTDSRGCQATAQIEIGQPGGMVIQTVEERAPTCFGGSDGALQVEVTGGSAPYTYVWNTGSIDPFISNLSEGNYELRVTDAEGCIAYVQYLLTNPDPVMVDLGEDRTICMDQGIMYDISIDDPDATYQWESDNGFSSTSPIVELTEGGTYKATAISSKGCVGSDELTVHVSENAIDAYFLLTTQAFAGEEVILVNISNPIGEEVEWTVPDGVKKIYEDKEKLVVHFEEAGSYDINLRSVQGSCYQDYTKKIIVEEASELSGAGEHNSTFINEFIIYPNPTDGEFKVKISLAEEANVSIKIINLTTAGVMHSRTESSANEYLLDYNLNLVPGMYIMLLETPQGKEIRKIIFN